MLQGTAGEAVVPAGAIATYRAYRMASPADDKMVFFPGGPHQLKQDNNRLRKVTGELAWPVRGLGL